MHQFFLVLALIMSSLYLTACVVKVPVVHRYSIENTANKVATENPSENTLFVNVPQASAGFTTADMAYSLRPPKLAYYSYHQWIATPAEMLQSVLLKKINDTHYFRAVVTPPTIAKTDLQLDTRLLQFYLQASPQNVQSSQFIVQLKADLLNAKNNNIIFSQTFSCNQIVAKASPYNAAQAANIAVNRCVNQLLGKLVKS